MNNGVYRAGFATTQDAYEEARDASCSPAWTGWRIGSAPRRYLAGERITEADWRLFTTLVRFDAVYHGHFKCNLRRLVDYPNLWAYTRELYQWPGVAETVDFAHIKGHYYGSHATINPTGIVPKGPIWISAHRIVARGCARPHKAALLAMVCLAGCTTLPTRPEIATPLPSAEIDAQLLVGSGPAATSIPARPAATDDHRPLCRRRPLPERVRAARRVAAIGPMRLGQRAVGASRAGG